MEDTHAAAAAAAAADHAMTPEQLAEQQAMDADLEKVCARERGGRGHPLSSRVRARAPIHPQLAHVRSHHIVLTWAAACWCRAAVCLSHTDGSQPGARRAGGRAQDTSSSRTRSHSRPAAHAGRAHQSIGEGSPSRVPGARSTAAAMCVEHKLVSTCRPIATTPCAPRPRQHWRSTSPSTVCWGCLTRRCAWRLTCRPPPAWGPRPRSWQPSRQPHPPTTTRRWVHERGW
jgi:hypothetical protein